MIQKVESSLWCLNFELLIKIFSINLLIREILDILKFNVIF